MMKRSGSNIQDVKGQNRMLILKLIATGYCYSRADLARATGLAKMTVGNIVSELLSGGIIEEQETTDTDNEITNYGRKPIRLAISSSSPCICGMLIKRGLLQVILSNLDGSIFEQYNYPYTTIQTSEDLTNHLLEGFHTLQQRTQRRIIAIGISSLGPIDSTLGTILNPPYFYNIENLPIVAIITRETNLPTYLVNDANAGALAEKLYGTGKEIANFTYLHIMNGIGAGFILHNKLYNGNTGQSGEIGHTSINFAGPKCACGNTGCLDLYANLDMLRERIQELSQEPFVHFKGSPLSLHPNPDWLTIIDAANTGDLLATTALNEFCSYISYTLVDTLNLLDLSNIIVGYDSTTKGTILEDLLHHKISKSILSRKYHDITVLHSSFNGDAPLIGSIAIVADQIFTHKLSMELPPASPTSS